MNKFLLCAATALATICSANATEVTYTPADKLGSATLSGIEEWTPSNDFAFAFSKNDGATAPAFNKAGDIRLYAKNTAVMKAADGITIEKVVFTISAQGKKRLATITATPGTIATQAQEDDYVTWTGSASEITFTVGDISEFGSEAGKAGQFDFSSVTITYSGVGEGPVDPDPIDPDPVDPTPENVIYDNTCMTESCGFESYILEGDLNPWSIDSRYGLKASAYLNGAPNASEAIMVSPVIDLTGRTNIELSYEFAVNQFRLNGEMIDYTQDDLYEYVDVLIAKETAENEYSDFEPLEGALDISEGTGFSWTYLPNTINLNQYQGEKVKIGFYYYSTDEIAGTIQIKNVKVTGDKDTSSIVESAVVESEAPVYYNMQGIRVAKPENGLFIKIQGKKSTKIAL